MSDDTQVHTPPPRLSQAAEFTAFMRAYQDMVFSTAARLTGNDAHAQDIAQEVFLKAYENFGHLRTSATAGGWLKTVVTNLTLNHLSRYRNRWRFFSELRRDDTHDEDPELNFAAPETPFFGVDADEREAIVEHALKRLPEQQRVPLVLFHFEEMPYQQIAELLRISLPKVKTDIRRARAALAKTLASSGLADQSLAR